MSSFTFELWVYPSISINQAPPMPIPPWRRGQWWSLVTAIIPEKGLISCREWHWGGGGHLYIPWHWRSIFQHGGLPGVNFSQNMSLGRGFLGVSLTMLPDMIRSYQIWPDTTRYDQILPDTTRFYKIWPDITRYDQILLPRCSKRVDFFWMQPSSLRWFWARNVARMRPNNWILP